MRTGCSPDAWPTISIDSSRARLLDASDGSPRWGSKGNAVRGVFPNAVAAPATVSGESFVICHWESRSWEGDEWYRPASQETCRQPWSHAKMSVGEYRHWPHQWCASAKVRLRSL